MAAPNGAPSTRFEERTLVILLADLAGFTRSIAGLDTPTVAAIVDDFYVAAARLVTEHGGRVVKYSGDSCLAVFESEAGRDAVSCALALRDAVPRIGEVAGITLDTGINVHRATVVAGMFGPQEDARFDLVGTGVIHTFRMGSGAGIRISEPVYRQLPSDERSPWQKHQPPATYTLVR
jgi:class 3 adenylate cyclase